MANPMMECHALLTLLGGGSAPGADVAARVEAVVKLLQQYSLDDLTRVAEFLDATAKASDRAAALDAAKVEVGKRPQREAAPRG